MFTKFADFRGKAAFNSGETEGGGPTDTAGITAELKELYFQQALDKLEASKEIEPQKTASQVAAK
ncbi:MAG: hypothetical protein AAFN63_03740 [Pseudomonadota bacterium]